MGIHVRCPNGHVFKVKDKYAGKKGLCPLCDDQVVVRVPDLMSTATQNMRRQTKPTSSNSTSNSGSVFDESASVSSSGSLLSGSVIQHKTTCNKCGKKAPIWYARCPACGEYLDHS